MPIEQLPLNTAKQREQYMYFRNDSSSPDKNNQMCRDLSLSLTSINAKLGLSSYNLSTNEILYPFGYNYGDTINEDISNDSNDINDGTNIYKNRLIESGSSLPSDTYSYMYTGDNLAVQTLRNYLLFTFDASHLPKGIFIKSFKIKTYIDNKITSNVTSWHIFDGKEAPVMNVILYKKYRLDRYQQSAYRTTDYSVIDEKGNIINKVKQRYEMKNQSTGSVIYDFSDPEYYNYIDSFIFAMNVTIGADESLDVDHRLEFDLDQTYAEIEYEYIPNRLMVLE